MKQGLPAASKSIIFTLAVFLAFGLTWLTIAGLIEAADNTDQSVSISDKDGRSFNPQVEYLPNGDAVVVWESEQGSNSVIQLAVKSQKDFSDPISISNDGQDSFNPQLSVSPNGEVLVVWESYSDSKSVIQSFSLSKNDLPAIE